jgi:16S rRNA (adenine1518-N6/adenine1519-N6)-dimethyltransferase
MPAQKNHQHKKQFGQHFLLDASAIEKTVLAIAEVWPEGDIWEVGPGEGALTKALLSLKRELWVSEIDRDLHERLEQTFAGNHIHWLFGDFLKQSLPGTQQFALVGNFPYNISTEIVFKLLDHQQQFPVMVGMFQKEVAQRLCAPHGSKTYGITSVLTQAFYSTELLFTLPPNAFNPPPKVDSAVVRFVRRPQTYHADLPLHAFKSVVKMAFNQRRKTLKNALSGLPLAQQSFPPPLLSLRAEQISVPQYMDAARAMNQ